MADLIQSLAQDGPLLSRETVDEIVGRGEAMIEPLARIATSPEAWENFEQDPWPVVHAVLLIGAIGGPRSVQPLAGCIPLAVEAQDDLILETLPAIFAKIGPAAVDRLRTLAADTSADSEARTLAIDSLAGIAASHPEVRDSILKDLRSISDADEDIRAFTALMILDFARPEDRAWLEQVATRPDAEYDADQIKSAYKVGPHLERWRYDWTEFYSPEAIESRRRDWQEAKDWSPESNSSEAIDKRVDEEVIRILQSPETAGASAKARDIVRAMLDFQVRVLHRPPWDWDIWDFPPFLDEHLEPSLTADAPDIMDRVFRFYGRERNLDVEALRGELAKFTYRPKKRPPLASMGDEATESERLVSTKTVGRNDPCPCGSGKKYKKCCGSSAL